MFDLPDATTAAIAAVAHAIVTAAGRGVPRVLVAGIHGLGAIVSSLRRRVLTGVTRVGRRSLVGRRVHAWEGGLGGRELGSCVSDSLPSSCDLRQLEGRWSRSA